MPELRPDEPPPSLEGFRIGPPVRRRGALSVHRGTSRLDLPVEILLVPASAFTPSFTLDAFLAAVRHAAPVQHETLLPFVTGGRAGDWAYAVA